jgi:hypothetical protein
LTADCGQAGKSGDVKAKLAAVRATVEAVKAFAQEPIKGMMSKAPDGLTKIEEMLEYGSVFLKNVFASGLKLCNCCVWYGEVQVSSD